MPVVLLLPPYLEEMRRRNLRLSRGVGLGIGGALCAVVAIRGSHSPLEAWLFGGLACVAVAASVATLRPVVAEGQCPKSQLWLTAAGAVGIIVGGFLPGGWVLAAVGCAAVLWAMVVQGREYRREYAAYRRDFEEAGRILDA